MKIRKLTQDELRSAVRRHYGSLAASSAQPASCCDPQTAPCCGSANEVISLDKVTALYEAAEAADLPAEVRNLSLGCGDPVSLAELQPGQTVLDLGCGGGIDCFLAAQRVGDSGHVIGVDMTAEMIEKARQNKAKLGVRNVEFRLGEIEHLPVADQSVDVIISNCVINLSPDKTQVFREAYRVLKPGGRLAVSDILTSGRLPEALRASLSAWVSCVAGALSVDEWISLLRQAGFVDVGIQPHNAEPSMVDQALEHLEQQGISSETLPSDQTSISKAVFSAKITARKPQHP